MDAAESLIQFGLLTEGRPAAAGCRGCGSLGRQPGEACAYPGQRAGLTAPWLVSPRRAATDAAAPRVGAPTLASTAET